MAIPSRTMRDIRTLSGKVDRIANSYMAYMQITCLEMEKVRKMRERTSAMQRMENLNARIRAIDAEKATLLSALAAAGASPSVSALTPGRPVPARSAGGFKLRY